MTTIAIARDKAALKEMLGHLEFPIEQQKGNQIGKYRVDACFSDDGRLIDIWIEADGDTAEITEDVCRGAISFATGLRKMIEARLKEIDAPPTVIEDAIVQAQPRKTTQPVDDAQASLPL